MLFESLRSTPAWRQAARAMPQRPRGAAPGAPRSAWRHLLHAGAGASGPGTGISRGLRTGALAALLLGVALPTAAACAGAELVHLEPVRPEVWRVAAAEGEASPENRGVVTETVVVRERDRVWLVGSGPTPAHGAALACAVETALGRVVTDVINTRAHPELAMGNVAFRTARIWALDDVANALGKRCSECLQRLADRIGPAGAMLSERDIRVPDRRLGADGKSQGQLGPFQWWALPRAAGERTLVLRLREQPVLIAQGLVWPARIPNLRETDSRVMISSLQRLHMIAKGASVVLGEQGPVGTPADIDSHQDYIVSLRAAISARVKTGTAETVGLAALSLPMFTKRLGDGQIDAINRQRVWREVERAFLR